MGGITWGYVLRRVGMWLLTILIGTTLIFMIPRLAPGDPVAAMIGRMQAQAGFVENSAQIIEAWRARFGLDQPLYVQYFNYLFNSLRFDFGYSLASFPGRVNEMVLNALPWTIGLLSLATVLSFIIGNTIGALMAWDRTPGILRTLLPTTLTFTSIPFFMLGILLIYVFAFGLRWLPPSGAYGRGLTQGFNLAFMSSVAYHAILPAMAIVVTSMGLWAIGMRGMMITTAGEDYMILAQAKGLKPSRIFWLYGVRNSILPQVTALALTLGAIVGGSLLVEYIFAYPGVGYLLYQGIVTSDYTLIQGIVFMLIFVTATAVLVLDLIYPLIDPRITFERG
ncbi:MAG: ABC transporter permease [Caldilinea sp.]|nr:ABC transporter permease [Caldilinea sp.]MCB0151337.1 ABC transporter permease [Caldilineaceae bacterium]MCB0049789.1 ABC transporter permease [Caldilinea sp.]MCB9116019.1 ABC transporter permease [Caldilineaceae bacterium]MCO5211153.1 ABC transporter permease [Caldilinea sp.]